MHQTSYSWSYYFDIHLGHTLAIITEIAHNSVLPVHLNEHTAIFLGAGSVCMFVNEYCAFNRPYKKFSVARRQLSWVMRSGVS